MGTLAIGEGATPFSLTDAAVPKAVGLPHYCCGVLGKDCKTPWKEAGLGLPQINSNLGSAVGFL